MASQLNEFDIKNQTYFDLHTEIYLDGLVTQVKAKPNKKQQTNAQSFLNQMSSYFSSKLGRNRDTLEQNEAVKLKQIQKQPGKKDKVEWSEITASCAFQDKLIIGFGNGALAIIKADPAEKENVIKLEFTGEEDTPVDKLRVMNVT